MKSTTGQTWACIIAGALILLIHSLDYRWRIEPTIKPEKKAVEIMQPVPQCRLMKNGRPYTGYVLMERDGGKITGGCTYEYRGRGAKA